MGNLAEAFGYKIAWLAIKDSDPQTAASALGVAMPTAGRWTQAIAAAYSGGWLFTPPLDGWTLVASTWLGSKASDPTFPQWLGSLSAELGSVQFFCTNRIVELHAWAKASAGTVERAYVYLGEVGEALLDVGDPTAEERSLREAEVRERDEEDMPDGWFPDEESVLALAGAWSIDPRDLDGAEVDGTPYVVSSQSTGAPL